MLRCNIYLDESGDQGFSFTHPYRQGGSSRHLTLSAVVCKEESSKHVKRFIKTFYKARYIPHGREVKWASLDAPDRMDFAQRALALAQRQNEISYHSLTVYKPKVQAHIRTDPNKLYNYMCGLLLLPVMRQFDEVAFIPDARTIKVQSGNSLHDYLQIKLWFEAGVATTLTTYPSDSASCRPLHFADYLCGSVQSHFEDADSASKATLDPVLTCNKLFFLP